MLLTREEFNRKVFARSAGQCAFCDEQAVDAHHILERKLYPDGGFYLSNGIAVCAEHHWQCEITKISVAEARAAVHIKDPVLPPGFSPEKVYDKWGNEERDGLIYPGPLAQDTGCRKALEAGRKLWKLQSPV